ncbi:protein DpdH [Streptosporangium roseum]|uniref:protein DpdH n=1 Tax=Streptosporangium roseum TaxID=2001 RepID=UPI0033281988
MTDLRGYRCWEPDVASRTTNTEAVNPSPALFLATHAPLRIHKARIQGRTLVSASNSPGQSDTVDESAVLHDFLTRKLPTGTLLMPIVGDSGSGKSHLVRWVRENIPHGPETTNKYNVIYLEKSRTSLKAVIESLLEGVIDDSLDALRSEIRSFSSSTSEEKLARRLINALNEALAATNTNDVTGATARMLTGPRGLALLLQDPHIQEHMLTEGKFIPQLAHQLLRDRGANIGDRPPGFTVHDLPLNIHDIEQAAVVSKKLLGMILSRPELQSAAVDLLNVHLENAIREASNLGVGKLLDAMLQVRRSYAQNNKEIILLIEDFALIQGVQGELLEALTESATREGTTRYAPIRTLMAVTTGYFKDLPETVMSRVAAATAGYVYDLDHVFDEADNGTELIASFVGRYLNAARVGDEELDRRLGQAVPNYCTKCSLSEACHQSFGKTEEGYGLYPFNRPSLLRMVHSVTPPENPYAFVPRTVLSNVVRPILVEHADEIREVTFPERSFKERFRTADIDDALPTSIIEIVEQHSPQDAERQLAVLEFWGDGPRAPLTEKGVLDAFGIASLPDVIKPDPSRKNVPEPRNQPSSGMKESLRRKLAPVEDWAARDDHLLPQTTAADLRAWISDSVLRRYTWSVPLMREMAKKPDLERAWTVKATTVSIEGANGERLPGVENAPIKFKRNALNSQLFQSLIKAKEEEPSFRAADIRRLASLADLKARDFRTRIETVLQISDADLVVAFRASLIGAMLAGKAWPGMDEPALLTASLDEGRDWVRQDQSLHSRQWQSLLERHLKERANLVDRLRNYIGISQGSGAVKMIDAARALPLLHEAARSWAWPTDQSIPEWVKPAVFGFNGWLELADEQLQVLVDVVHSIRRHVPVGVGGSQSLDAFIQALKSAEKVGVDGGDTHQISDLAVRVKGMDWHLLPRLEEDIKKALGTSQDSFDTRLRLAVRDYGPSLEDARNFLVLADRWLDRALSEAKARSHTSRDDIAAELQRILTKWASLSIEGSESGE